jgi:hypothetical protein
MPGLDDSESENEATKPLPLPLPAWVNSDLSQLRKKQLNLMENYTKFIHQNFDE